MVYAVQEVLQVVYAVLQVVYAVLQVLQVVYAVLQVVYVVAFPYGALFPTALVVSLPPTVYASPFPLLDFYQEPTEYEALP